MTNHHNDNVTQTEPLFLEEREAVLLQRIKEAGASKHEWLDRYAALLEDPRPFYTHDLSQTDKFAGLVKLISETTPVFAFFIHPEVETILNGVGLRTVKRWEGEKSRPASSIVERVSPIFRHVALKIADRLLEISAATRNDPKRGARYNTLPLN